MVALKSSDGCSRAFTSQRASPTPRSSIHIRQHALRITAFGPDPYAPLEKAINVRHLVQFFRLFPPLFDAHLPHLSLSGMQIINRILTIGETRSKSASNNRNKQRERWVQFGAVASSRLSLQDLTAEGVETDRETTSALLEEYLALPVDQYSLLDPKWVCRENNNNTSSSSNDAISFRVSIPLQDMLGVDLCPEVSITAHPDPSLGQVTLIGSRAALGSPGFDELFQLNLVAVLRARRTRVRRPRLPDHIPGRPVMRLRQWAARRAKSREVGLEISGGGGGGGNVVSYAEIDDDISSTTMVVELDGGVDVDVDVDDLSSSAPFPSQKIYISGSRDDDDEDVEDDEDEDEIDGIVNDPVVVLLQDSMSSEEIRVDEKSENELETSSSTTTTTTTTTTSLSKLSSSSSSSSSSSPNPTIIMLDCKVHVTMAVKVPGPLRVVPNRLLGYAGGMLSKAVLSATLPNFLQLLSGDFKDWANGGQRRRMDGNEGTFGGGGGGGNLFTLPSSSSSSVAAAGGGGGGDVLITGNDEKLYEAAGSSVGEAS